MIHFNSNNLCQCRNNIDTETYSYDWFIIRTNPNAKCNAATLNANATILNAIATALNNATLFATIYVAFNAIVNATTNAAFWTAIAITTTIESAIAIA